MPGAIETAYVELRADTTRFRNEARSAGSAAGDEGGRGFTRGFGGALATLGLGAAAGAMTKFGLGAFASLEMAQVGFEGLLGSGEAAEEMMGRLTDFAAATPLELPGLADMTKNLLAMGAGFGVTEGNVLDFVTTIGDVTSVLGGGQAQMDAVTRTLGQMSSLGRVSAGDMNQLANALPGFNVWQTLADGMGMSVAQVRELSEAGELASEEAIPMLLAGMQQFPGAAGAMERASQTLTGVLSTFKDTAQIALAEGLAPLADGLKAGLVSEDVLGPLQSMFTEFGGMMSNAFAAIQPAIGPLLDTLGVVFEDLGRIFLSLSPLIEPVVSLIGVFATTLSEGLADVFVALAPAIAVVGEFIGELADVLSGAFMEAWEGLEPAISLVAEILGDVLAAVLPVIIDLLDGLLPIIGDIADMFGDVLADVLPIVADAFMQILDAVKPLIPIFQGALQRVFTALRPVLPALASAFVQIAVALAEILVALTPLIPPLLELAVTLIETIGVPVLLALAEGVASIAEAFALLAPIVTDLVAGPLTDAIEWFTTFVEESAVIREIIDGITSLFSGDWSAAWETFKSIADQALTGFTELMGTLLPMIGTALGDLGSAFLEWVGSVDWGGVASAVWNAIVAALGVALPILGDWLGTLGGNFVEWFGSVDWAAVGTAVWNAVTFALGAALSTIGDWIGALGTEFGQWFMSVDWATVGTNVWNAIVLALAAATSVIADWIGALAGKFGTWFMSVDWAAVALNVWNALVWALGAAISTVGDWIGALGSKFGEWFADVDWALVGTTVWNAIVFALGAAVSTVASWIATLGSKFGAWFSSVDWGAVGTTIWNAITFALGAAVSTVADWIGSLAGSFSTWFSSVDWPTVGTDILGFLVDALEAGISTLSDWFGDLPGMIGGWIVDAAGDMMAAGGALMQNMLLGLVQWAQEHAPEALQDLFHLDQWEDALNPVARLIREKSDGWWDSIVEGAGGLNTRVRDALAPLIEDLGGSGSEAGIAFTAAMNEALADGKITEGEWEDLMGLAEALGAGTTVGTDASAAVRTALTGGSGGKVLGGELFKASDWEDLLGKTASEDAVDSVVESIGKLPDDAGKAVRPLGLKVAAQIIDAARAATTQSTGLVNASSLVLAQLPAKGAAAISGLGLKLAGQIVSAANAVVAQAQSLVGRVALTLAQLTARGETAGRGLMSGLLAGIASAWSSVSGWLSGVGLRAIQAVGALGSALSSRGVEMMNGLRAGLMLGFAGVSGWLNGLSASVRSAIGDMGSVMFFVGAQAMQGFERGIIDAGWGAIQAAQGVARSVAAIMRTALQIKSPSRVFEEIGALTMAGFEGGLKSGWADTADWLSGVNQVMAAALAGGPTAGDGGGVNVTVEFHGALPTDAQAYATGVQAARGISDEQERQRVRVLARTSRTS